MLLRLIFISVNTGLSSALFAFLSVLLVRVLHSSFPTHIAYPRLASCTAARPISDRSHLHSPLLPPGYGVLQYLAREPQRTLVHPRWQ